MKKKILIAILIVLLTIIIFIGIAFIPKETNIQIDIQKLANELINSQIFEDNLSVIDNESIIKKYNFDINKIKDINSYVGTGATAEEILIIELKDKAYINEAKKIIETKIDERKIDFENYLPKEVFKLENYNLESNGNYIILCISNDSDKANEIIRKNINS